MNIEAQKAELFKVLDEIRDDINKLTKKLDVVSVDLDKVETLEDAKAFNENCDLEEGLKYIRLFREVKHDN